MNDPVGPILPLTWEQWGLILVPLYILLVLWMQWCMRKVKGGR